jgi:hypothetical protein
MNPGRLFPDCRPEHQLLLRCARVCLDAEQSLQVRKLLEGKIDWDFLFAEAARHRLIPLLYHHLHGICRESALVRFRTSAYAIGATNLWLTTELLKLLALLNDQEIPAIPYRGPTLAVLAYGNIGLRHFSDLDIIIRREDFPKAKDILVSMGYQADPASEAVKESTFLRYIYNCDFWNEASETLVDLHWETSPKYLSFPLDFQEMRKGLERQTLAGKEILSLKPEYLLPIICVHCAKHVWGRLAWICDVAALIEAHPRMDWGLALDLARKGGVERLVRLGLFLANDLLQAPLPEDLQRRLQADAVVASLGQVVYKRLFQSSPVESDLLETVGFQLTLKEHWRGKFLYCGHLLFTPAPEDLVLIRVPPALSFIYYLIRPGRLIGKFVMRLKSLGG